jgi:hypothetical protein
MPFKYLLVMVILILLALPGPTLAQADAAPTITATPTGISLTWSPPSYTETTRDADGQRYSQLAMAQTQTVGRPGYPELPLYSRLIGLPPSGEAKLRIIEVEGELVTLAHPPLPSPLPQPMPFSPMELETNRWAGGGPTSRTPDPTLYATDAFYPEAVAELGPVQQLRRQRLAALTIHPLRVNPVSRQMEVIRFIRLEITFTEPTPASALSHQARPSDPLAQALAATLLNPEAAQWPTSSRAGLTSTTIPLEALATGPETKVVVNQTGLHALSYTALQNAGLPLNSLDPRTLKLSYGYPRQEVAIVVEGEADGMFNSGDRVLFYAQANPSRFVSHNVYFLSYGGANGLRMAGRSGNPAGLTAGVAWRTAKAETNQYYEPLYPGYDGDHWYWDKLFQPSQTTRTYTLQVDKPLTTGPAAALSVWLRGYTDPPQNPDHRLKATVNGAVAGEITWNGTAAITATFAVASATLLNGQNQVALSLPGIGTIVEGTWLDAIAITYPTNQATTTQLEFQGEAGQKSYSLSGWTSAVTVYDITNPTTPQQVSGYQLAGNTLSIGDATASAARYLLVPTNQIKTPQSLQAAKVAPTPAGGADYLIITHPTLISAVAPLAARRSSQGLRVTTVDVEAIYDSYGPGYMDPLAIKNLLQTAYINWPAPAPLYVLLVGDGTYDPKDFSGYHAPTLIPPYLAQVDPWWGETAADNQFVTLSGNDHLPEMLIGRLPVNTAGEAATVVNKIIQYETNPAPGLWNAYQLFVADNPDSAGNFHTSSDTAFGEVSAPFIGQRFYYSGSAGSELYLYTNPTGLKSAFLSYFNSGASLITFYGHSSWLQWAVEDLFEVTNVGQLTNQSRLPVILEMTCFTGFFHHPAYPNTLDESLLRRSGGGAIAVWGSTGLGVSTGHDALYDGFYQTINQQSKPSLGAATLAGKLQVYSTGVNQDLLNTYTLFGDPATTLNLTVTPINFTSAVYLPLLQR